MSCMAPKGYSAGLSAHCRRVAAWAGEIARSVGVDPASTAALQRAAILHHRPVLSLEAGALPRLMADLKVAPINDTPGLDPLVAGILSGFHGKETAVPQLAGLLELADNFDAQFELETWLDKTPGPDCPDLEPDPASGAAADCLRVADRAEVLDVHRKLPVFPLAAQELMRRLANPNVNLGSLEQVAAMDPALALTVIRAANSAYFAARREIRTLRHAIAHIGFDSTRNILYATAMRPLFASRNLRQLWNHSLECAQMAERIADLSGAIPPQEAFVAGLIHDLGRLSMALLPAPFQEKSARLREQGCECVLIERTLCGIDHAEAGGELLTAWKFPRVYAEAIRYHHRPERTASPLAALLYVTEFWAGSEEDLPSRLRLKYALSRIGLDLQRVYGAAPASAGFLTTLALAA